MNEAVSFTNRYSNIDSSKACGATYTPSELGLFVAKRILANAALPKDRPLRILDPAIGDGALIIAMLDSISCPVEVFGFETNSEALAKAQARIADKHPKAVQHLRLGSFLEHVLDYELGDPFGDTRPYDLIIANPPYVRTQVMGAERAGVIATQFGLSGRVDLYQAFLLGMARVLATKGTAGFIVSNRFMTTKAGAETRAAMIENLRLREIYDLGDTKIFDAAVLPAVLIGRGIGEKIVTPDFSSIYETEKRAERQAVTPLAALEIEGCASTPDGRRFVVQHGKLNNGDIPAGVWRLTSKRIENSLAKVRENTWGTFRDIGKIRVGIKSCADRVYLPKTWDRELELHRVLTTHHAARRFYPKPITRKVLYPHHTVEGRQAPVDLTKFPKSAAYLEKHRKTLERRRYVIEAGRQWYEIWVPQNPAVWIEPKLVFRDISEQPTFWMDLDGTVVNGDCYWLTGNANLLWLALGVANSTFIEWFYDRRFNNKLYSGRRRFITQYVEQFPIPDPESQAGKEIIDACRALYESLRRGAQPEAERQLDEMVWAAFGLSFEEV